ncbi:MAG: hypothetical protein KIS82_03370 [Ferruginibacter sp.]|nr:hypothetical protein [Bacteroidota bacterium]MCW5916368.1 hypothetical protein [Ferruginibacter sp.]
MALRFVPLIFISLFGILHSSYAQPITGVWEGIMDDEFIQINIQQKGTQLCGYTYDYVLADKSSYCIARFEGKYNSKEKKWYITGTSFIANSGSHILMKLLLWYDPMKERKALNGVLLMRGGFNMPMSEPFELRKVSSSPYKMPKWAEITPCFPEPESKPQPVQPKAAPKPPAPKPVPKQPKPKPDSTVNKKLPSVVSPVPEKKETLPVLPSEITKKMGERRQSEQSRVVVNSRHLNLKIFDNGTIDGDSVSVFYNGKLLISHQRLSDKPIELNINLDSSVRTHEITLYAENLGSIPPNTAMIIVTAGHKRFELRSKANLEENAVLVFEYKPEEKEKQEN